MKAIAIFFFSGAMLVSSISAFAMKQMEQNVQSVQQWVGKPATQLVKTLGEPNYTSTAKHGRLIYDFVQERQHVGPIVTYQFIIGRNGKVAAATLNS